MELAKVDVDANPQIAQAFQVQSIPAVYAVVEGQVVDSFIGALPEAAGARSSSARLTSAPRSSEVERLLDAGDEASLRAALELEPDHEGAVVALAELLVERGEPTRPSPCWRRSPRRPRSAGSRPWPAWAVSPRAVTPRSRPSWATLLERVKDDDEARKEFVDLLEVLSSEDERAAWRRKLSAQIF